MNVILHLKKHLRNTFVPEQENDEQRFCAIRIWRSERGPRFFSLALAGRRSVWVWAEETSGPEAHSTCYTDEEPWTDQWRTWHSFLWTPYSCKHKHLYYCFHNSVSILNISIIIIICSIYIICTLYIFKYINILFVLDKLFNLNLPFFTGGNPHICQFHTHTWT